MMLLELYRDFICCDVVDKDNDTLNLKGIKRKTLVIDRK